MNANEARLRAARIWLVAAEAAGMAVTVVGGHVYCGSKKPEATYRHLLTNVHEHKSALVAIFTSEDEDSRFAKARAMFPGPEKIEGE